MIFEVVAYIALALMVSLILFQATYVWIYRRWMANEAAKHRNTDSVDGPCAVILCLRGADPSLEKCLEQLAAQTHPNYRVFCVVDNLKDSANEVVEPWIKNDARFCKLVRPETVHDCSLKCAALVHAIEQLDESFEFVVLIDADTIPHKEWLCELLAPMADSNVGAVSGNRWFEPADNTMGSWVRYVWNAAAVVQMYLYSIAWGGSLALRRKTLEQTGLLEKWGKALCEDTMIGPHVRRNGWGFVAVGKLMMVNRERISLGNAIRWTYRQLLFARLYHWRWWLVFGHGILLFGSSWLALGVLVAAFFIPGSTLIALAVFAAALANYLLCGVGLIMALEKSVRAVSGYREAFDWPIISKAHLVFAASVLLFFLQPLGTAWASVTRKLVWRGVRYRIKKPFDIAVENIEPMASEDGRSI